MIDNKMIKNNFEKLVHNISRVHEMMQSYAVKSVNQFLTLRNWIFGYYIVEYEQKGEDRAKYGENLIVSITQKIKHIKGLTGNQLYTCRNFYLLYPHFLQTVSQILQSYDTETNEILRTLSVKLQSTDYEEQMFCGRKNVGSVRKSRRDDILLTVDFNLRNMNNIPPLKSPAGTTLITGTKCRPCGILRYITLHVRRLKPTVNTCTVYEVRGKVSSLRDFAIANRKKKFKSQTKVNQEIKYV